VKRQNTPLAISLKAPFRAIKAFFNTRIRKKAKARFLYLEVTHRCNLACITCYTGAGVEKENALTLEEQKNVVRQAKAMGVRAVSLSGSGEPLMYPHLLELIDFIRELDMSVIVFTNGTLIDQTVADALISRKVLTFFKLYSLDPDVFDRMVARRNAYRWVEYRYNAGSQEQTQQIPSGLKALLDAQQRAGCADCVKVETLITQLNVQSIPNVAKFCKDADIGFFLETPVFKGKAIRNYDQIAVSAADYQILYEKLSAILGLAYMTAAREGRCSVEENPVVWTDGRMGLCSSRAADVGNVRNEPLKALFLKVKRQKQKEDRLIARHAKDGRYFRTCPSRQACELRHNLPCDY